LITLVTLFVVPAIYMLVARDRAAAPREAETEEAVEESEIEEAAGVAAVRSEVLLSVPREPVYTIET
jgi:hypothetical protein